MTISPSCLSWKLIQKQFMSHKVPVVTFKGRCKWYRYPTSHIHTHLWNWTQCISGIKQNHLNICFFQSMFVVSKICITLSHQVGVVFHLKISRIEEYQGHGTRWYLETGFDGILYNMACYMSLHLMPTNHNLQNGLDLTEDSTDSTVTPKLFSLKGHLFGSKNNCGQENIPPPRCHIEIGYVCIQFYWMPRGHPQTPRLNSSPHLWPLPSAWGSKEGHSQLAFQSFPNRPGWPASWSSLLGSLGVFFLLPKWETHGSSLLLSLCSKNWS